MGRLKRFAFAVLAVLFAMWAQPAGAVAATTIPVISHTFEDHRTAAPTDATTERGPPVRIYDPNATSVVDAQSRGTSVCQRALATSATHDYDGTPRFVQVDSGAGTTTKPADAIDGGLLALPPQQVAANNADTVVVGRVMPRVEAYAEKLGGAGTYAGTPGWVPRTTLGRVSPSLLERVDIAFNRHWIRSQMRQGKKVVDIGTPVDTPVGRSPLGPSPFYEVEMQELSGYSRMWREHQP